MAYTDIPQALYDVYLNWGNDFVLSSTNDLLLADGSNLSDQRIIRRLMTNPLDYIWDAVYGAGLPSYVGQPESTDNLDNIRSSITQQIFLENTVSQIPQPEIFMQTIQNGLFAQINYTLSPSQQAIVLNFEVSP
jgi:hypothetical protein